MESRYDLDSPSLFAVRVKGIRRYFEIIYRPEAKRQKFVVSVTSDRGVTKQAYHDSTSIIVPAILRITGTPDDFSLMNICLADTRHQQPPPPGARVTKRTITKIMPLWHDRDRYRVDLVDELHLKETKLPVPCKLYRLVFLIEVVSIPGSNPTVLLKSIQHYHVPHVNNPSSL